MLGLLRSAVLMVSLMLATPGQAQSPPGEQEVKVASGQEVQLLVLNNTGGDCSGLPTPDVEDPGATPRRHHHCSLWTIEHVGDGTSMRWSADPEPCGLLPP